MKEPWDFLQNLLHKGCHGAVFSYLCTMMKTLKNILLWGALLLTGIGSTVRAQAVQGDSVRVSLLTCGSGTEIYNLFGHTAIRYQDAGRGIDYVFNYGMFSFDTPNFVLRFTLGQTDYMLGVEDAADFIRHYRLSNRDVREQVLDMTAREKARLYALLIENYRPENRTYRYNFFYDNCSTRPRDKIETVVAGGIDYHADMQVPVEGVSFRSMIHRYTEHNRWSRFGIDMLLGSQADEPITRRQMMFIPFCLEENLRHATRHDDTTGQDTPLVTEELTLNTSDATLNADTPADMLTPMRTMLLIMIAVTAATIYGLKRRRSLWGMDAALLGAAGTAGCILTFLALFSEHPAVGHNWLLCVFQPLHLLLLPWVIVKVKAMRRSIYMTVVFAALTLFMLFWGLIPQDLNAAVLPLALCLWMRAASNLVLSYNKKDSGRHADNKTRKAKTTR